MPCNIGYRDYSRVRLPSPQPQEFKEKTEAPKVDAELLERLGEDDPEFLEWLEGIDIVPLLREALVRALAKVGGSVGPLNFSVSQEGYLEARATYKTAGEKKKIRAVTEAISNQFQMEALGIVAQLLDYDVSITRSGTRPNETIIIEGEKERAGGIAKYLRITKNAKGDTAILFEHFASKEELAKEKRKFLALSQKLGVKITILDNDAGGKPIPGGIARELPLQETN